MGFNNAKPFQAVATFSLRKLRRLAKRPGPVSFKEWVAAWPPQWVSFAALDNSPERTALEVAYGRYERWCKRNGKDPLPFEKLSTNWSW